MSCQWLAWVRALESCVLRMNDRTAWAPEARHKNVMLPPLIKCTFWRARTQQLGNTHTHLVHTPEFVPSPVNRVTQADTTQSVDCCARNFFDPRSNVIRNPVATRPTDPSQGYIRIRNGAFQKCLRDNMVVHPQLPHVRKTKQKMSTEIVFLGCVIFQNDLQNLLTFQYVAHSPARWDDVSPNMAMANHVFVQPHPGLDEYGMKRLVAKRIPVKHEYFGNGHPNTHNNTDHIKRSHICWEA